MLVLGMYNQYMYMCLMIPELHFCDSMIGKIPEEVEVHSIHDILLLGSCTSLELCELVDRISDMLQTIQILNVSPMKDDYIHVQKTVLCLVVVFNQKRAGEATKIKLLDYTHHRLEIPGKWGRHVPIILTNAMRKG